MHVWSFVVRISVPCLFKVFHLPPTQSLTQGTYFGVLTSDPPFILLLCLIRECPGNWIHAVRSPCTLVLKLVLHDITVCHNIQLWPYLALHTLHHLLTRNGLSFKSPWWPNDLDGRLSDMNCIVTIWRSWVQTPVESNLGCVVLLSKLYLN